MARYIPVRERAIRALKEKLETITIANGYNFDVRHVYRKRYIPERADDPVEIHMLFGETEIDEEYNVYQNKEYASILLWFILPATGNLDEDLQYNLMVADILSCIADDNGNEPRVIDETHPEYRVVDVYLKGHMPRYNEARSGLIIGRIELKIGYAYLKSSPYRWDVNDESPGVELV